MLECDWSRALGNWPLELVIHIVGDDQSIEFTPNADQLLAPFEAHCFRGRIGECRNSIDDMAIYFRS